MPKSASSYALTRFNARKWATHEDGPMTCAGSERCRYGFCVDAGISPLVGSPCPCEEWLARRLADEFEEQWGLLTIMPDVEDFDALQTEAVNIRLQQKRAMARLNNATLMMENRTTWAKATKESKLADLYLDRLSRRQERLNAELQAGLNRMRERADRYRTAMPVVEYLLAARAQLERPLEAVWDEFVDGAVVPVLMPTRQGLMRPASPRVQVAQARCRNDADRAVVGDH
jgi:hypothetical protein